MNFPLYLLHKDRVYSIQGYINEVDEYIDGKGYIKKDTGDIYIYRKGEKTTHDDIPSMVITEDGSVELEPSLSPENSSAFNAKNLCNFSYKNIVDKTSKDDQLYNEEALADMNSATSVFTPTIKEDDDPLKKLIKYAIISKGIDINRLKHKMPQKYGLSNMKSALVGKTKMSISNFIVWTELLEISFEVILVDNGKDEQNPLRPVVHYDSVTNKLTETRR